MDELLRLLDVARMPHRYQYKVARSGRGAAFHRGGMQAVVAEVDDGLLEVKYEHALHEVTCERCNPAEAAQLLRQILQRDHLFKVELTR